MRTTVELAADLLRAAKARSAERGESLKALLTRAVEAELGNPSARAVTRSRVALPLFGGSGPAVRLSSTDLERALAGDDAARMDMGAPDRRRRRTR
jgi:hypothetical protein